MKKITFLFLLLHSLRAFTQDENLQYFDLVYNANIATVRLHPEGQPLSPPVMELTGATPLRLTFDDLDGDNKSYTYTVVHCNTDWTPSTKLIEQDYISGFLEPDLLDFEYSFKSKSIFTHYWLYLPNRDMRLTKSGNYLLKVYENEDSKRLIITRRFMVTESVSGNYLVGVTDNQFTGDVSITRRYSTKESEVKVTTDMVRTADVGKSDTHQEIDFTVQHPGFEIRNPRQELSVVLLQNGRWDNALTNLKPQFSRPDEQQFDYQNKIVFPAGREFRYADLRTLLQASGNVAYLEFKDNVFEATLKTDHKRGDDPYYEYADINGNFIIQTFEENDSELESEYVNVLFSLYSPSEMDGQEIFLFGGFTDWQLKAAYRMVYNPLVSSYVCKVRLKQGYYNYLYAALPAGADRPVFEQTEGDWYETENDYNILVYYRPFGGRYDRLICAHAFSSRS